MVLELERLAGLAELTPLEYVAEYVANGDSLAELARKIGCPRPMLSTYVHSLEGADTAMRAARIDSGDALVEQAEKLLADCEPVREEIALTKERVNLKLWRAERADPARLGAAAPTVAVQINVGRLHIDSMQQAKAVRVGSALDVSRARVSLEPQNATPALLHNATAEPARIAPLIVETADVVSIEDAQR